MKTTLMRFLTKVGLLALAMASSSMAQEVEVSGVTQRGFGQTDYTLRVSATINDQLHYLKSQLEFPLDVWMLGASARADWPNSTSPRWSLEGSLCFAVTNPASVMMDHDWYRLPDDPYTKFSYTESDAEMAGTQAEINGSWWLFHWGHTRFALLLGYRHYLIRQDLIGYRGWQLDDNGNQRELEGTARGIYYSLTYYIPQAGIRSRLRLADWLRWDNRLSYLQVFASDYDDHLLRNKVGTANVHGVGGALRCEFAIFPQPTAATKPVLTLYADLLYLQAWGDQTQTWYGDDPASPDENDTGQVVTGIPHDVESLQFNIGLQFGFAF